MTQPMLSGDDREGAREGAVTARNKESLRLLLHCTRIMGVA